MWSLKSMQEIRLYKTEYSHIFANLIETPK